MSDLEHFVLYFAAGLSAIHWSLREDVAMIVRFMSLLLGIGFAVVMFYWTFHDWGIVG